MAAYDCFRKKLAFKNFEGKAIEIKHYNFTAQMLQFQFTHSNFLFSHHFILSTLPLCDGGLTHLVSLFLVLARRKTLAVDTSCVGVYSQSSPEVAELRSRVSAKPMHILVPICLG